MVKENGKGRTTRWGRNLALILVLFGPRGRWIFGPLVLLLALWGGLGIAWRNWGDQAATGEDYVVSAAAIAVTPQQAWIHSDVKAEVVRSAGLDGLLIRDPQLVEQVQRAFALNGWVARVKQVRKRYPAQIAVDLEYRQPVAMVEVNWKGQPSLYFVDKDSVLLPKEDQGRSPQERDREYQDYLRIDAGDVPLAGRIPGQPWGGLKIAGAARLAALGGAKWRQMGVHRIIVSEDLNAQPLYELETSNAARLLWGHAPGAEDAHEPAAEEKWKWLAQFVAQKGSLDRSASERRIDLRTLPAPTASRTTTPSESKVKDR